MRLARSLVLMCLILLSGCQTTSNTDGSVNKEQVGTVIGGVIGAILGNELGKGKNRKSATALGALAGAWLGKLIGSSLDERDRLALNQTIKRALDNKNTRNVSWNSEHSSAKSDIALGEIEQKRTKKVIKHTQRLQLSHITRDNNGIYKVKKSSNMRFGPSTEYDVVTVLGKNKNVRVNGLTQNNWYLVSQGDINIGYVHATLLSKLEPINLPAKNNDINSSISSAPSSTKNKTTTASTSAHSEQSQAVLDLDEIELDPVIDLDDELILTANIDVDSSCRNVNMSIYGADGNQQQDDFLACKNDNGVWEI